MPLFCRAYEQCHRGTSRTLYNNAPQPPSPPPPVPRYLTIFFLLCVLKNVYGTKLSIDIIRKRMLTYKFRKDMLLFVFFVVSLQLIWRLSRCGTDICCEFSYGKSGTFTNTGKLCLEYLFVDVLWIKKRISLITKRQFHAQNKKQNHTSHHYGRYSWETKPRISLWTRKLGLFAILYGKLLSNLCW